MTSIRPLQDRILLKTMPRAEKTAGGLYIPPSAREDQSVVSATVLAVGPGRMTDHGRLEPHVKTGDTVLVGKYAGTRLASDDTLLMVREDDLHAVVE